MDIEHLHELQEASKIFNKSNNINDYVAVENILKLLQCYDIIIPLLDNSELLELQDIGYDMRDALKDINRLHKLLELDLITNSLQNIDNEAKKNRLIEIKQILNKYEKEI